MSRPHILFLFLFNLFALFALTACGGFAAQEAEYMMEPQTVNRTESDVVYMEEGGFAAPAAMPMEEELAVTGEMEMSLDEPMSAPGATTTNINNPAQRQRLIIKTGELALTVDDTAVALQNATDLITAAEGYIISQHVWQENGHRYANLQVGVPVTAFERTLSQLRRLGDVTIDVASGQDVTDEYVDLDSRLGNLQATQARLREFLAQAQNVEEILAVNAELSRVEEELEVIQGRMNYLADRAAFSTINVTFNPILPTPTPWPTPTPPVWNPLGTAEDAGSDLVELTQELVDGLIYTTIFCGPWMLIAAFLLYLLYRFARYITSRRQAKNRPPTTTAPRETE
jgi:hypothetical protein